MCSRLGSNGCDDCAGVISRGSDRRGHCVDIVSGGLSDSRSKGRLSTRGCLLWLGCSGLLVGHDGSGLLGISDDRDSLLSVGLRVRARMIVRSGLNGYARLTVRCSLLRIGLKGRARMAIGGRDLLRPCWFGVCWLDSLCEGRYSIIGGPRPLPPIDVWSLPLPLTPR